MSEEPIPSDWAIAEMAKRCRTGHPVERHKSAITWGDIAIIEGARLIAAHEEPVDPLLVEARKLADEFWPGEQALTGKLDNAEWTKRLVIALRRGIALASEQGRAEL